MTNDVRIAYCMAFVYRFAPIPQRSEERKDFQIFFAVMPVAPIIAFIIYLAADHKSRTAVLLRKLGLRVKERTINPKAPKMKQWIQKVLLNIAKFSHLLHVQIVTDTLDLLLWFV